MTHPVKDEISLKVCENIDIKTENVKLSHQVEQLTAQVNNLNTKLAQNSRILQLRNEEIAVYTRSDDSDRCLLK